MENYYFAGGMYQVGGTSYSPEFDFDAVRPSGNHLPYITLKENGLKSTSHHSSLYRISEDLKTAELVDRRSEGRITSPVTVKLSEKLQREFRKVISDEKFYE